MSRAGTKRRATVPLYVMVTPEQDAQIRGMARALGLSLRELVVNALDVYGHAHAPVVPAQDALCRLATDLQAYRARGDELAAELRALAERLNAPPFPDVEKVDF